MNNKDLLNKIQKEVYCRVQPSPTHHGVGVFAIKNIPRGTKPFGDLTSPQEKKITHREITKLKLEKNVSEYLYQMYLSDDQYLYIEDTNPNHLPIYYFINHSESPNIEWINTIDDYFVTKNIKIGEELLLDYREYGKELNVKLPSFLN
jgi:SET domain-containing protein